MSIWDDLCTSLNQQGLLHVLRKGPHYLLQQFCMLERSYRFKSESQFRFRNKEYNYFHHPYNKTWINPRAVEIPVAWHYAKQVPDEQILEVGNVLNYYFPMSHTVIDKYENTDNVNNVDVIEYQSDKTYELVLCISTLEHIGYDHGESVVPEKPIQAVKKMQNWVANDGLLLVTIPYGYNPHIDAALEKEQLGFTETYHLCCQSRWNEWEECTWNEVKNTEWGEPYEYANGLTIAYYYP